MLTIQISLAVIVLQTFIRKELYWVLLAISFHTIVEAARVITLNLLSEYLMYAVLGAFAIISVLIILSLRRYKATDNLSSDILSQAIDTNYSVK
jgi:hypothetical protein